MANLPPLTRQKNICIICEGLEDYEYFNRLRSIGVFNSIYKFKLLNVKGASNIFARYQNEYNSDDYEAVLIFCDTDKFPYREYAELKRKLKEFHDKEDVATKIVMYANPCTMQIILSHFGDVELKKQGKKTNADVIERLTGVKNYAAHEDQIKEICGKIYNRTYEPMKERICRINLGDETSCSSNFCDFLEKFESDDVSWLSEIEVYLSE